ncbi:MAG: hypothetical protein ABI150_08525 [Nitrobacter sp.]
MAPQAHDSGQHRGKRHIRGGTRHPAQGPLHASPRRRPIQCRHESQISGNDSCRKTRQGRHHNMRKLIILANALLRANRPWTEKIA